MYWERLSTCMASHKIEETGLSNSGPSNYHHLQYAVHCLNPTSTSFINQEGPAFDFGELEEAILLQGFKTDSEAKPTLYTIKPAATLEMFPSWPMRFHQSPRSSRSGGESTDSGSAVNTISSKVEAQLESESPISKTESSALNQKHLQIPQQVEVASDSTRTGVSLSQSAPKPSTEKTLRRLAQNREAARKSRIRKKAYVQQLESSRLRLTQLEQDLQRARSQGLFLGGGGGCSGNISPGAAIFDMEYGRWVDDDHRHMSELRMGLQAHLPDGDMMVIVDSYIAHYDEIFGLKGMAAKSDVFHLITGMWTTPAERCFLWIGGFRPSGLIKMLIAQLHPLTEQQIVEICSLQQSSQQAEEALSHGLEQLQHSLIDTIASVSVNDGMHHMVVALGHLTNLEGFIHQADNLRQQILHHLRRILTIRQAARCFLVIGEYYGRLRALSSLWASRPQETLISNLQMVQNNLQNHFSNF